MQHDDDQQPPPLERRRMHPEVEIVMAAIQSRDDTLTALRGDILDLPAQIGAAIQASNMRTVSDPAFWAAAGDALRRQARDHAGGFVLDGLRSGLRKLAWLFIIVGGVYMVGGWSAIAALFKGAFASHT